MVREIDDGKWFAGRGEPNWENEAELERLQEVKRRREEAEPYNDPAARRKAREVGKKEAARRLRGSVKNAGVYKNAPRGLSVEGSSSSEFMSAVEDAYDSGEERQAIATAPVNMKKRKRRGRPQEYVGNAPTKARKRSNSEQKRERKKKKRRAQGAKEGTELQNPPSGNSTGPEQKPERWIRKKARQRERRMLKLGRVPNEGR